MSGATLDIDQVRAWLAILYGDAPGLIHVSSTGNWAGRAFTDHDEAAAHIAQLDATKPEGIYLRATTLREQPRRGRGGEADSLALPGLWADLDIAGPGHKTAETLPPDEGAARRIIATSGLPEPTLWVHSGGGLYPWWLLDKPAEITPDTIGAIRDLSNRWQVVIGRAADKLGWHYGTGVGDLARVLRVPGTVNRKEGLSRPCRIIDANQRRYSLDELRDALAAGLRRHPDPQPEPRPERPHLTVVRGPGEISPCDDFEQRVSWDDPLLLGGAGWRIARGRPGEYCEWIRPGKTTPGISATTGRDPERDRLYVFSTEAGLPVRQEMTKPYVYALLHHGGDMRAATRALARMGYGTPRDPAQLERDALAELARMAPPPTDGTAAINPNTAQPEPIDVEAVLAERRAAQLRAVVEEMRLKREARKLLDAEEHAATWREPPSRWTLTDELAIPDEPLTYRVDGLIPTGGNVLLTAQYKAGKTTLVGNLVRCLADGEPFLSRFEVTPPDGRIAIFNYEVDERQYRRWLRDLGISNTDSVTVLNLRGYRLPVIHSHVEDWIVRWLTERDVRVWAVDPFARAFVGCGDENSNSDVGAFLDALDVIKERAGVSELILPAHTGRGEFEVGKERARGATRLDDWADVRWLLTIDDQQRRYFRATGRDVDVPEEMLNFDPLTRHVTLGGWDRRGMKQRDLIDEIVAYVTENPGLGMNEIIEGLNKGRTKVSKALQEAIREGRIVTREGDGRKRLHYPGGSFVGVA